MEFKIGQKVVLIDNSSMAAPLGATATVVGQSKAYLCVQWEKGADGQGDGEYYPKQFKPLLEKGKQLEFSFMEQEDGI